MNTLIHLAALQAARAFDSKGTDGVFSLACFGMTMARFAGIRGALDGEVCRAMLNGQPGIEALKGGCHFRIRHA